MVVVVIVVVVVVVAVEVVVVVGLTRAFCRTLVLFSQKENSRNCV